MWKLYSESDRAIAIHTTYQRLRKALAERVYIGIVHYVDYKSYPFPLNNSMWPFVFKRESFKHESELRALIQELPVKDDVINFDLEPKEGHSVSVNISALVEKVVIAPFTPDWYFDLVSAVTKRYGFELEVRRSSLHEDPVI